MKLKKKTLADGTKYSSSVLFFKSEDYPLGMIRKPMAIVKTWHHPGEKSTAIKIIPIQNFSGSTKGKALKEQSRFMSSVQLDTLNKIIRKANNMRSKKVKTSRSRCRVKIGKRKVRMVR
jgi:hypothetical protein